MNGKRRKISELISVDYLLHWQPLTSKDAGASLLRDCRLQESLASNKRQSQVCFPSSFYKGIFYFLICFFLSSSNIYSQKTYVPDYGDPMMEPWRWTTFDELSGKGVRCIAESADGNIWFGTNNGIIRYNGLEWKEYNSDNEFEESIVDHLIISDKQNVYAGTNIGLYVFKNGQWERIFPLGQHSQNNQLQRVNCLKKLRDGSIVASVGSGIFSGLVTFHDSEIRFMASELTMDSIGQIKGVEMQIVPGEKCINKVFCVDEVFQDRQDRIWISASQRSEIGHVFYYTTNRKSPQAIQYSKNFTLADGLVKGVRIKFGQDKQGNIWAVNSEFNIGISIFNNSKWNYFKLKGENTHLSICNINGNVWIGGFAILSLFENGIWKKYQRPLTPIPEAYLTVYKDSSGFLWIIGTRNEVIRIDYFNKKWGSFNSLNFQCEDKSNNLWFLSVDGKVVVKKGDDWFSYDTEDGLPDAPVKIYCTKKGQICVAGSYKEEASISFLNAQKWERQVFPKLSWGIDYRALYEDADENLWLGASVNYDAGRGQKSGLIKLQNPGTDKQKKTHYFGQEDLRQQNAYGIAQTKDGSIWLAGSRLNRFSNGQWSRFIDIEELTQFSNCMGNTPTGELWVGSRLSGVFWYNNEIWKNFNTENGLKSNTIISLFPVNDQDIWMATNRDFSRYDGKSWTTDILPDDFTLSREGGDIQIQPDGTLWINHSSRDWKRRALNKNIVEKEDADYFTTFSYKADTLKPDTKITLYSEEVPSTGNTFIEWTGKDVWQSNRKVKLQYSYRLNDDEWSDFSYKNNITFFNLKDGKYTFEVKARDMDFNIDSSPDRVNFIVLPPVWKQTWFIVLIIFFLAVIIAYQYSALKRKKYLEKLNVQLEKHSDEIEQKNLLLEEHSDEIERKNILLEEQKEQILQQNILEKERNLGKIKFFTNISHEFRTPLTLVAGIIDTLSEKTLKKSPSFFHDQLSTIKRNANQLLRLINQLMDFRKLENQSMVLKVSESDLVSFIDDVCNSFKEFAQKHQIELSFNCDFKSLTGWFDRNKMERILFNLISNAIKFTTEGGRISVTLQSIVIKKVNYVEIIIEDTGTGIADDEVKKIFEPFYQGENLNKSRYEGTGIGLSIVNNLISLHHGNMRVTSSTDGKLQLERGFSTRFAISISLEKSAYKEHEFSQSAEAIDSKEESIYADENSELETVNDQIVELELPNNRKVPLVVVVEDNDDLRQFILNSLRKRYKAVEARNGAEGFDLVVQHMPDIVISDILMPKMSGTKLCYKLKKDIRTSHIPVILLTARTTDENKIEGFKIGADDYITKPFNMSILLARINNILLIHSSLRKKYKNEDYLQPEEVKELSIDEQFLQKVNAIVKTNYTNHLFGVEELSTEVGISRRHLLFKLQNLIDMTPNEYIKTFRLKRAAQMLSSKKASISEIVFETGFNDISYFSKCFTKYYGMNPSKYIKTHYKR